jgi:hypothetical protein
MLPGLIHTATAMAAAVVLLGATSGFAGPKDRRPTVVVHPRYVPFAGLTTYQLPRAPVDTLWGRPYAHGCWQEIGVGPVGHRRILLNAIAALRTDATGEAPLVDAATTSSTQAHIPKTAPNVAK